MSETDLNHWMHLFTMWLTILCWRQIISSVVFHSLLCGRDWVQQISQVTSRLAASVWDAHHASGETTGAESNCKQSITHTRFHSFYYLTDCDEGLTISHNYANFTSVKAGLNLSSWVETVTRSSGLLQEFGDTHCMWSDIYCSRFWKARLHRSPVRCSVLGKDTG